MTLLQTDQWAAWSTFHCRQEMLKVILPRFDYQKLETFITEMKKGKKNQNILLSVGNPLS